MQQRGRSEVASWLMLAHARRVAANKLSCVSMLQWLFLSERSDPKKGGTFSMANVEANLRQLGIVLPEAPTPGANYISAKTAGRIVYLAGVISTNATGVITGTVGANRTIDDGYAAARACALTQLAVLKRHLGSLDEIKMIVGVNGYVNAVPGFPDSPKVINGASDLFVEVFGEAGRHVRAAIGVNALPLNALVELQMTVEVQS
jgi:enamine deaminase RidA (YjgF/YER057c/UK114 family)